MNGALEKVLLCSLAWNHFVGVHNKWTRHSLDKVTQLGMLFPECVDSGWLDIAVLDSRCLCREVRVETSQSDYEELPYSLVEVVGLHSPLQIALSPRSNHDFAHLSLKFL